MNETQLLIATHNQGKLREFEQIFHDLPLRLVSLTGIGIHDDIAETGETFADNARLKSYGYAARSGLLTFADDSGLEIDALGGKPGVRSARYAPTPAEYRARVLREMQDVPEDRRTARFRCVINIAVPTPSGIQEIGETEASVDGRIAYGEAGEYGFGYDPIFYLPEYGCTMAQLDPDVKNRISHRALAAEQARKVLMNYLGI